MKGDTTGELWGQVRTLQNEVTIIKVRQDDAIKHLHEYLDACEENKKCADARIDEHKMLLQEILVTQKAYNKLITRSLPFMVVIFTAGVSVLASWIMEHLGVN